MAMIFNALWHDRNEVVSTSASRLSALLSALRDIDSKFYSWYNYHGKRNAENIENDLNEFLLKGVQFKDIPANEPWPEIGMIVAAHTDDEGKADFRLVTGAKDSDGRAGNSFTLSVEEAVATEAYVLIAKAVIKAFDPDALDVTSMGMMSALMESGCEDWSPPSGAFLSYCKAVSDVRIDVEGVRVESFDNGSIIFVATPKEFEIEKRIATERAVLVNGYLKRDSSPDLHS